MDETDDLDIGRWLVEHRADMDLAEAVWLERLAEFDRGGGWALDGHFCCATWLVWRTGMARSTAFEKLRVAQELSRRPVIADAFRGGRLSYSAVRAITRMDRPTPEVDEALVNLAGSAHATIVDVERVVRSYILYSDQEQPPGEDALPVRDVKIRRGADGTGQVTITLSDLEIEEFAAALQAFIDRRYRRRPVEESSAEDSEHGDESDSVVQGSLDESPIERAGRAATLADAFMDLVGAGLAGADDGFAAGDDRYLVHVVTHDGGQSLSLLDGSPLHPADAGAIGCDCSRVSHSLDDRGEALNLGRKTREWSTAQRRSISVRDGGHCRFPGCRNAHFDIHHMQPWEAGGRTDTANGVTECRRHHRMLHAGYRVQGHPNGELRFYRPNGTYIGSTLPAVATRLTPWM